MHETYFKYCSSNYVILSVIVRYPQLTYRQPALLSWSS